MNIDHIIESEKRVSEISDDNTAGKYYGKLLKKSQSNNGLSSYSGPEYLSILRTIERFSLMTHLIFLFQRKKISKKDYLNFSMLSNTSILVALRRKKLLSELER